MEIITLKDVWLKYRIEFKENGRFIPEDFWALKGINLSVNKGETICIIGENGAGKSTLLRIIAGMLNPDRGSAQVKGTVSGLIDIGSGFQRDLTGKENIYLISSLYGLTKEQIEARYNDIVNFAAIGRFIHAPVKSYSQGMFMRLGFAIAIHVDLDILVIDDIFAVGDIYAQRKCINKIFELKENGKTIVFITHDLETAKRICSRGIFLRDGEIIKNGPIDKVCSYYAETIGDKKGIALLQEGLLGVIFNNGKLILRWKDSAITSNLGGYSRMLFAGREYLSTAADWQVQAHQGEKGITAIGRWPDIPVSQCWKVSSLSEGEFLWEIIIQMSGRVCPEKFETKTIFIDEYKRWFTLDGEKDFPESFLHEEQWQCTLVDDAINTVVGLKADDTVASLPVIVFDRLQDNNRKICYVGNTGFEINGRALQYLAFPDASNANYAISKYRGFLSKIMIFNPDAKDKFKVYLDRTKQVMQESKVIRKGLLSMFCKDHKIEIFWQDKLLSRGIGLNTQFRYRDKNYSALNGHWVIHKENSDEIVITISWDDKPMLKQIWRLKLQGNDSISWEIAMEIGEEIKIRNRQSELLLSEEYEKWITPEEKGGFDRLEKKGGVVILNKYTNKRIGVESVYKVDDFILPEIVFCHEDAVPRASYIFKIKEDVCTTKLQYVEIDSKENPYMPPGRHEYFKGVIKVDSKRKEGDLIKTTEKESVVIEREERTLHKIEFNKLSLVFDYGKGRIFWDGVEFTKGLGLYSSVFLQDRWHDSSQAFWEVQRLDKKRLLAVGHWPWISMAQNWEISLLDEETLLWKITKETWEDVVSEREQVSLMVSDKYTEWFSQKKTHGKFPQSFIEHNGVFWDRLWCGNSALPIGIKRCKVKKGIFTRQFLPSIIFDCSADCQARYSIIENTDNLFQSRVLQYELDSNQESTSDKNKYFEGRIKIVN